MCILLNLRGGPQKIDTDGGADQEDNPEGKCHGGCDGKKINLPAETNGGRKENRGEGTYHFFTCIRVNLGDCSWIEEKVQEKPYLYPHK